MTLAKRQQAVSKQQSLLFADPEPVRCDPLECLHKQKRPTATVWPGETCTRFTWTCDSCGEVWGRCP